MILFQVFPKEYKKALLALKEKARRVEGWCRDMAAAWLPWPSWTAFLCQEKAVTEVPKVVEPEAPKPRARTGTLDMEDVGGKPVSAPWSGNYFWEN